MCLYFMYQKYAIKFILSVRTVLVTLMLLDFPFTWNYNVIFFPCWPRNCDIFRFHQLLSAVISFPFSLSFHIFPSIHTHTHTYIIYSALFFIGINRINIIKKNGNNLIRLILWNPICMKNIYKQDQKNTWNNNVL